MFWEKSFEELHTQIQENKDTSEISDASFMYLNQTLDTLHKSDWELEDYESNIISKQLEYHRELQDLSDVYDEKIDELSSKNKNKLLSLFVQLENSEIPDTKLKEIDWILENKKFEQTKDSISGNIDIQWWLRWMLDWIISLNEDNKLFLDSLSLFLLNNSIDIPLTQDDLLDISQEEFSHILNRFVKVNLENKLLPKQALFNLSEWEYVYNFEEKIKYYELLFDETKLEQSIIASISWKASNEEINIISENLSININWLTQLNLINYYVSQNILTHEDIFIFHENNDISTWLLLKYLEQDKNFNLLEYLENYPLPEKIKNLGLKYARNTLKLSQDEISDSEILANMHTFIITFLHIESSGRNIANVAWASSAKWYYQFLTANWKNDEKWNRLGSSFQTAVKRTKRNLDSNEFSHLFWDINVYKPTNIDPRDLSAEAQTILFFNDIIENWKKINNNSVDEFMKLILMESNTWALWKIYKVLHHTNPDKATKEVFTKVKNNYFYWEWKLLAKNHY